MAKAHLYLDTRGNELKSGGYPLKVVVTHERKPKMYGCDIALDPEEYAKILTGKRLSPEQQMVRDKMDEKIAKAKEIIKSLPYFSFDTFRSRWDGKGDGNNLVSRLNDFEKRMESEGRVSNETLAYYTRKHLTEFMGGYIPLKSVTPKLLSDFEAYEYRSGRNNTTVRFYMGIIKKVLNEAIASGELEKESYPFGQGKYIVPAANKSRRAMKKDRIGEMISYKPKTRYRAFARHFYLFSYLSSGMNMADVAALRWVDFDGMDSFTFMRRKTAKKVKEPVPITIRITPIHMEVIDAYGSRKLNSPYVFDFLRPGMTPKQEKYAIHLFVMNVNHGLESIAKEMGWERKPTTYYARHSYATVLAKTAPIAYISQQLGHTDITTTMEYIGQFEKEDSEKYEEALLPKKTGA